MIRQTCMTFIMFTTHLIIENSFRKVYALPVKRLPASSDTILAHDHHVTCWYPFVRPEQDEPVAYGHTSGLICMIKVVLLLLLTLVVFASRLCHPNESTPC